MPRPRLRTLYLQTLKSNALHADELINIVLLRPIAAVVVWLVYPTSLTPNQLTMIAIAVGFVSAYAYGIATPAAIAAGGILILAKDILDDADGQLARAKSIYSRRGRFLDSVGDAAVNIAVFSALTHAVYRIHTSPVTVWLGALSLAGITLRVSYHVFYQVSFLHLEQKYELNRTSEEVTEEDMEGDEVALRLQQLFQLIYGWQDRFMIRIDRWCRGEKFDEKHLALWYSDRLGLRLTGLMGFGTEYALLAFCSWTNSLDGYLLLNVFLLNGLWLASVLYRRLVLSTNLSVAA